METVLCIVNLVCKIWLTQVVRLEIKGKQKNNKSFILLVHAITSTTNP